jgi:hypothetical protein
MPVFTPLCHTEQCSGETLQIAPTFSKCKRGQLELSQEAGIETLAEIYLKI